ncbi:hypothetical protein EAO82_05905 [Halopseudomonas pelagia]|uniref:Uncharacterized protein n=1 Tax=Halopseudomonas pelagia TaxID=553151 RepID=A0ABX6CN78_9GAMM|nr:hypothetical protein EAO82_05905 [Halopseudomonas pelagia]
MICLTLMTYRSMPRTASILHQRQTAPSRHSREGGNPSGLGTNRITWPYPRLFRPLILAKAGIHSEVAYHQLWVKSKGQMVSRLRGNDGVGAGMTVGGRDVGVGQE